MAQHWLERLAHPGGRCVGRKRHCGQPALIGAVKARGKSLETWHLCPVCAAEWAKAHEASPMIRGSLDVDVMGAGCALCGQAKELAACRRGCDLTRLCHDCQIVHGCWFAEETRELWDEDDEATA